MGTLHCRTLALIQLGLLLLPPVRAERSRTLEAHILALFEHLDPGGCISLRLLLLYGGFIRLVFPTRDAERRLAIDPLLAVTIGVAEGAGLGLDRALRKFKRPYLLCWRGRRRRLRRLRGRCRIGGGQH